MFLIFSRATNISNFIQEQLMFLKSSELINVLKSSKLINVFKILVTN